MKGQREVVAAALAAARAGRPGVLVTVVRVEGSAYRRPGARMFLPRDGEPVGLVSGGCLESDLAERAALVLAANEPQTVLYDMRSPDDVVWGLGLGCNGAVRVLLEPVGTGAPPPLDLDFLTECDAERKEGVVVTVFGGPAQAIGTRLRFDGAQFGRGQISILSPESQSQLLVNARTALAERKSCVVTVEDACGPVDALVEYVQPAIRLVVCGAGLDAMPVVEQASALGWTVHVLDHRPAFADPERFAAADDVSVVDWSRLTDEDVPLDTRTAVVLMTHHFLHDVEILTALVPRVPEYVGLLGPRQRATNMIEALRERDVVLTDAARGRLHGPVGLDVGSETPEEIALSLVAEIQASFAGRAGGLLREREAPLHDWKS